MSIGEALPAIDPRADADAEEVLRLVSEGKPVTDPELRRRVYERAQRIRQEVFEKHGLVDIAVPSIREVRNS